jgi:kynurenine formamidase
MNLPRFDELPVIEPLGMRHAWDVFGAGDNLGTLNLITPERVVCALAEVRHGRTVTLSRPLSWPSPPLYDRAELSHEIFRKDRNRWDDKVAGFYPQSSTQWDGFRHIRCREYGFYQGIVDDPPDMGSRLGIDHWARRGIVGRGVLLDVASYLAAREDRVDALAERAVTAEELTEVADAQGLTVQPGDILCLRFGWTQAYEGIPAPARASMAAMTSGMTFAGLRADEEMARLIWNWGVAAVAADNPAVEVSPGDPKVGSLHRRLLALLGVPLGELFDFDELASLAAAEGKWSFLFVSVPLHLVGGVGSPANAIAIL